MEGNADRSCSGLAGTLGQGYSMDNVTIRLHEITKTYGCDEKKVTALRQISLTIEEGEFLAIMGPSGAGKTTLLTILGAMNQPTSGRLFIGNQDVYQLADRRLSDFRHEKIGFVFQQYHLVPYLTVLQNVLIPLVVSRKNVQLKEKGVNLLHSTGLSDKGWRLPDQLSGGEQARVAIARALINNPQIILADEPTGNLDSKTGNEIMELLKGLNSQGHTIIIVTHNPDVARVANRIIDLNDGALVHRG